MQSSSVLRQSMRWALVGFALGLLGMVWHSTSHSLLGVSATGWAHVLVHHSPLLVGAVVLFGSLLVAVRHARVVGAVARAAIVAAFGGATLDLGGQLWDNVLHAQLRHSETAHLTSLVGAVLVLVALPLAVVLVWRSTARSRRQATSSVESSSRPTADSTAQSNHTLESVN